MGKLNIVSFTFLFAACLMSCTLASYKLSKNNAKLMRTQIEMEMQASLFYQTYAHYFENSKQALHGFAKYFYEQSIEEKKHADNLMTYMNKRDAEVRTLDDVPKFCSLLEKPILCEFITNINKTAQFTDPAKKAIEDAVYLENLVYDGLETIAKGNDNQLSHFIEHEFLDEQVESIKELSDFQTQLTGLDGSYLGRLMMDRWLLEKRKTEL